MPVRISLYEWLQIQPGPGAPSSAPTRPARPRIKARKFLALQTATVAPPPAPAPADIRAALVARLKSSPDLAAVVGPRIRPGALSIRDRFPALAYSIPRNPPTVDLAHPPSQSVAAARIELASWNLADLIAAKRALTALLAGQRWTERNCVIQWSQLEDEQDLHEPPIDASDRWLFRVVLTYRLKHRTV